VRSPSRAPDPRYRERLFPPWWLWLVAELLVVSMGIALLVPLGATGALALTALAGAGAALGLLRWTARIEVTDELLRAGRARIPLRLVAAAVPLDAAAARALRGPAIDPRAYHLLRGWVGTAVRVDLADPDDPTPYWYLSTRHPERLAAAVEQARTGGRS
jgi:hypothetical protein